MDQITHEVRLANWKAIIDRCQARPEGQSTKQWLEENHISDKQYYYWLRRVRQRSYSGMLPTTASTQIPAVPSEPVALAEIPTEKFARDSSETPGGPAIVIKTKKSTIEISSAVSDSLMLKLVKAVAHAL